MTADMSYIWLRISALLRWAGAAPAMDASIGKTGAETTSGKWPPRAIAQNVSWLEIGPETAGYQISIGSLRVDAAGDGARAATPRAVSMAMPPVLPTGKTSLSGTYAGPVVAKGCSFEPCAARSAFRILV